ncbi:MAG: hypothetical protein AB7F67_21710, partial [Rhodospirillaceae bacterium]
MPVPTPAPSPQPPAGPAVPTSISGERLGRALVNGFGGYIDITMASDDLTQQQLQIVSNVSYRLYTRRWLYGYTTELMTEYQIRNNAMFGPTVYSGYRVGDSNLTNPIQTTGSTVPFSGSYPLNQAIGEWTGQDVTARLIVTDAAPAT